MAPKGTRQVRTLQDVQCKLQDCADAEAVRILEGADVILKGNRDDMRLLCSKWKGVKRYKDKKDRPDKELREDLKSAVLKAASEFLARQADVQHDVSGGASGSTEGRELLATGGSATGELIVCPLVIKVSRILAPSNLRCASCGHVIFSSSFGSASHH